MRYLIEFDVRAHLSAGRDVEQLLQERYETNQLVIRHVSIERSTPGSWKVRLCEVFDSGTPDFMDIYGFEPVDPALPFGSEWTFDSVVDALKFAGDTLGASPGRYVNQGVIQGEYKDRYHPGW